MNNKIKYTTEFETALNGFVSDLKKYVSTETGDWTIKRFITDTLQSTQIRSRYVFLKDAQTYTNSSAGTRFGNLQLILNTFI